MRRSGDHGVTLTGSMISVTTWLKPGANEIHFTSNRLPTSTYPGVELYNAFGVNPPRYHSRFYTNGPTSNRRPSCAAIVLPGHNSPALLSRSMPSHSG